MNNVSRSTTTAIVIAVVVACFILFSNSSEPVRVGFILPLSGPVSYEGYASRAGAELAARDVRGVDVIIYDSEFNQVVAAQAANQAVQDNLDALYSSFTYITEIVSPIAQAAGLPLFYDSCNCGFAEENPYAFQNYFDPRKECRALAERAVRTGVGKIAQLSIDTDYAQYCEDELVAVLGEENVLSRRVDADDEFDPHNYLEEVHTFGATTVALIPLISRYDPLFAANQARGYDTELFCYEGSCTLESARAKYPVTLLDNVYTFGIPVDNAFVERLDPEYSAEEYVQAALAYDTVRYTVDAVRACGNDTTPECFKRAVITNDTYESQLGSSGFDYNGFLLYETVYTKYTNGVPERVTLQ